MAKYERFEDLPVWQHAIRIGVRIYGLVDSEKLAKDYRAKDQLVGSAISISNNIAEGFEYNRNRQFIRYLEIAKGSAGELRSQHFLLLSAGKIDEEIYQENYLDLVDFSSELKGFVKYLSEFEDRKKKGD
ncbi:four helix bundle protein [Algoriphagus alkaliphilus]|uniref:Four helix bundle protein n=1 Tax=Algoriphagus alkaliphilus TaxID=279824 RepID=A0A1G5Y475_9BACT|nr:four helix bundle protein [Algoriphagus alkaliphilus]SDA76765.1 four helix bundle protein [Algoriphagus alkaliphilus]